MSICDCEPTVYDDGSVGHEQDCEVYPWCPHEVGAYACLMPCGCSCGPCRDLTAAHALSAPSGDEQGERAHGDVTTAQGSSAGNEGGKR